MNWVVLGDSVTGTSHQQRALPCQDAFRALPVAGGWLVVVVADGAGSASHAEIGARLACDEFAARLIAEIPPPLDETWLRETFRSVRESLVAEAARLGVVPRELACTLLVAVIGTDEAAFAQIGDGGIVIGDGSESRVVFWPEPAEYANATDFLTDDRYADALRFTRTTEPVAELAAFTDGLQRVALEFGTRSPHAPFFRPLFRRLREESDAERLFVPLREFLDSPGINARTDDDKTLVLAVRKP